MNPLLEIYPPACLLLVGPQVAAESQQLQTWRSATKIANKGDGAPRSYRAVVEAGIQAACEILPPNASEKERKKRKRLLRDAYERDPTLAADKVVEILKQQGCYVEWLQKTFGSGEPTAPGAMANPTLEHLLQLQSQGALLACTQYDTSLDLAASTTPILMRDGEAVKKWANREMSGFLHLHGVFSQPPSVQLSSVNYTQYLSESHPAFDTLQAVLRKRTLIFVGYDGDYFNPLILKLLKVVYPDDSSLRNPPILLTCDPPSPQAVLSSFLLFKVSKKEILQLEESISPGSEKDFAIGLERPAEGLKVQAFLLFEEKQSFRKLGDIIYQQNRSGEIYVRRDALTVIYGERILYGNLVTYGRSGLRQLWELVLAEASPLRGKGLVALGLSNAVIVWPRKKPSGLGNVTGINSVHTYAMTRPLPSTSVPALPSSRPVSLTASSTSSSSSPRTRTRGRNTTPPSEPNRSAAPVNPVNTFAVMDPRTHQLQAVQGSSSHIFARSNQLASSPATGFISVQPQSGGYDLNMHLQMIARLQNQVASTPTQKEGQHPITDLQSPKYCLATAPEELSSLPSQFQNQPVVDEHTIEHIDQLATPWSKVCNRKDRHGNHPAAQVQLVSIATNPQSHQRFGAGFGMVQMGQGELAQCVKLQSHGTAPSAFQRVARPEIQTTSPNKRSQDGTSGSIVLANSPTKLQLIPGSQAASLSLLPRQNMFVSPQTLVSPTASIPQLYSTGLVQQPYGCYMVVNPQNSTATGQPMLIVNPTAVQPFQVPLATPPFLPTGQQVICMLPDGTPAPAMSLASAPASNASVSQMTSTSHLMDNKKVEPTKRLFPPSYCDSPLPPPPKRIKRSASLPNILQPFSQSLQQTTRQDDNTSVTVSAEEKSCGSESLQQRGVERREMLEQKTDTTSGSDTETASSEVDDAERGTAVSNPTSALKGHIHLWEFLLDLLLTPDHGSIIQWTGSGYEFCIVNSEAVAKLWGSHKNKPRMTYEKMSRALRYYYGKGILERVPGRRLTYKFLFDIQKYISQKQLAHSVSVT